MGGDLPGPDSLNVIPSPRSILMNAASVAPIFAIPDDFQVDPSRIERAFSVPVTIIQKER